MNIFRKWFRRKPKPKEIWSSRRIYVTPSDLDQEIEDELTNTVNKSSMQTLQIDSTVILMPVAEYNVMKQVCDNAASTALELKLLKERGQSQVEGGSIKLINRALAQHGLTLELTGKDTYRITSTNPHLARYNIATSRAPKPKAKKKTERKSTKKPAKKVVKRSRR